MNNSSKHALIAILITLLITLNVLQPALHAASSPPSGTLPTGGTFTAGSGNIVTSGNILTINQNSLKGIIDWNTFSIGKASTVNFKNGSGATLNKVTGVTPTEILGRLLSTGSIYLLNPQGILIGHGAIIHTGGDFLAATLTLPNSAFLSNAPLTLSGSSSATVVNLGDLTSTGGNIYLIGHTVQNGGSITSPNGATGLAAGSQVLITDSSNNQKVAVQAPGGDVTNSGFIHAAQAELKSNGGNIYALAGNSGGQIQATGTATQDGHIWLIATHGTTSVAGLLSATNADGTGGQIETSGEHLNISKATIKTGQSGNWLIDPVDLTIDSTAASTIDTALATASVTLQTTANGASGYGNPSSGVGDININAPISWSSSNGLTLDAYHGVTVNFPITASGAAAALTIKTNHGGSGGYFTAYSPITLAPSGLLTINNAIYTLLNSPTDLQTLPLSGNYALNSDLDMSQLSFTPIGYTGGNPAQFTGVFEGLGHTLSGLTISQSGASYLGLFSHLGSAATVENLKFAAGSATLDSSANFVGMLAGENDGSVYNVASSGVVLAGDASGYIGGLIGFNNMGSVVASNSTGAVFAGINATQVGGLIGASDGTVSTSFATGAVSADIGASYVGGLVGINWTGGTIQQSYATGAVTASGTLSSQQIGGLVGENQATLADTYATGAVNAGASSYVGGLLGFNTATGTVATSYSIGAVSGLTSVGGLVGASVNFSQNAIPSSNFWDITTSGQFASAGGQGLATLQWLTGGPVANTNYGWDFNSTWVQGYPYPVLKQLPYIVSTVAPGSRQYGAANPTLATASAIDQKGNDATSLLTGTQSLLGVFSNTNIGSYPVLATGQTAPGYQVTYSAGSTLNITPALLTGVVSAANKVYDGTVNATGTVVLSGVVGSDNISIAGSIYTFASKNAANGIAVTQTGGVLAGSNLYDYQLVSIAPGTANITPLTLTVGGTTVAAGKIYDGTTSTTISGGTLGAALNGDLVSFSQSGAFNDKNAGLNKTVTYTNTLSGVDAGNYSLSSPGGTVTANITPALLSATYTAGNKVYDGTTNATANVAALSGVIASDSVGLTALFNFADKNVGSGKTVAASDVALTGSAANNYTVSLSQSGAASITPAQLTYVANTGYSRPYGTANPLFSGVVTGFVGGDTLTTATSGTAAFTSLAGASSPAGLYAVNGSGLTANHGNYLFSQAPGNATALTVIGELYFAINSATGLFGQTPTFSATYAGPSIAGLNIASLLSGLTYQITPALNGPGTYKVTATSVAPSGFIFNIAPATYTIIDSSPATLPSSMPILKPEIPSLFAETDLFQPANSLGNFQVDTTATATAPPNSQPALAQSLYFAGSTDKSQKFAAGAKP